MMGFMLEAVQIDGNRENTVVIHVGDKRVEKNLNDNLKLPIYMFPAASYSVY